jgi:hypothetical protein
VQRAYACRKDGMGPIEDEIKMASCRSLFEERAGFPSVGRQAQGGERELDTESMKLRCPGRCSLHGPVGELIRPRILMRKAAPESDATGVTPPTPRANIGLTLCHSLLPPNGTKIENTVPLLPGLVEERNRIKPQCFSMIPLLIHNPSPLPSFPFVDLKASNR